MYVVCNIKRAMYYNPQSSFSFTSRRSDIIHVLNYVDRHCFNQFQWKALVCQTNDMREPLSQCRLAQPCHFIWLVAWLNKLPKLNPSNRHLIFVPNKHNIILKHADVKGATKKNNIEFSIIFLTHYYIRIHSIIFQRQKFGTVPYAYAYA